LRLSNLNIKMDKLAIEIGENFNTPFGRTASLGTLTSIIISNALVIAGVILLFLLVFGGISVVLGAGSNDPQRVGQGKAAVTAALVGFILIFAAYWIIQIIELLTGVEILQIPL
jgi:Zn-dependent protease with chaperone function